MIIEDFLGIMSQWQEKSYRWIGSFTNIDTTQSMDNDSQIGVSSPTLFRIVSPHLTSQQKQSQQFPWYHCWQNTLKPNLPPLKNQHDITGIIYPTLSFGRIIWSRTHWNLLTLFSVNQIKHRKHFHLNIQLHIARNTIQLQQWPHLFVNNTRGASG